MTLQVCDRCRRNIKGRISGEVLHHPDVDPDYRKADLCPRCYRVFVRRLTEWLVSVEKKKP